MKKGRAGQSLGDSNLMSWPIRLFPKGIRPTRSRTGRTETSERKKKLLRKEEASSSALYASSWRRTKWFRPSSRRRDLRTPLLALRLPVLRSEMKNGGRRRGRCKSERPSSSSSSLEERPAPSLNSAENAGHSRGSSLVSGRV